MSSQLLWRHRPALCFDAQEPYRALAATSIADSPGNALVLEDGLVLARAGAEGEERLTLALCERYPGDRVPCGGDRIDQAPDVLEAAQRFQADPAYSSRCYGRVAEDGGRTWLQYWLWYLYNPKHLLGFGRHEGDWELVQVGLGADGQPAVVTCSQHESGEARDWAEVETLASAGGGLHPVIYVAPFSHANYFEPGAHPYLIGNDEPDGSLPAGLPEHVEELGAWARWPGRWGNSKGVGLPGLIKPGKLGGRSPASPARQGTRWDRPSRYHEQARRQTPWRRAGRLVRRLGAYTYPKLAELSVHLDGQRLTVRYGLARRGSRLLITVHQGDRVLLSVAAPIKGRVGVVDLELPERPGQCLIRASAFNELRQRSNPMQAIATQSDAFAKASLTGR
jgi:hypothetical protein